MHWNKLNFKLSLQTTPLSAKPQPTPPVCMALGTIETFAHRSVIEKVL